jgi:hypothetical protein
MPLIVFDDELSRSPEGRHENAQKAQKREAWNG